MKTKNMLLLLLVSFAFTGCSNKILLKSDFWQKKETAKIGVAMQKYPVCRIPNEAAGPGLLGALAATAIENGINHSMNAQLAKFDLSEFSNTKTQFSSKLTAAGFNTKIIESIFDIDVYKNFHSNPGNTQEAFFEKDIRSLSEKENIDYLILISIGGCGATKEVGFMKMSLNAFFHPIGQLIDLKTNKVLWRTDFPPEQNSSPVQGKINSWSGAPADFTELTKALNTAMEIAQKNLTDDFFASKP